MKAVETTGTVDAQRQLHLDEPLSVNSPGKVRVIILWDEDGEPDEQTWLKQAARNPAFDFLKDPDEDIYSVNDGKPFHDPR